MIFAAQKKLGNVFLNSVASARYFGRLDMSRVFDRQVFHGNNFCHENYGDNTDIDVTCSYFV